MTEADSFIEKSDASKEKHKLTLLFIEKYREEFQNFVKEEWNELKKK